MYDKALTGSRLEELRRSHKLSQKELADKLEVSRLSIGNYERGDRVPDVEFIVKAAKFFSVTTDFICGISNIRNEEREKIVDKNVSKILRMLKNLPDDCIDSVVNAISRILSVWDEPLISETDKKTISTAYVLEIYNIALLIQKVVQAHLIMNNSPDPVSIATVGEVSALSTEILLTPSIMHKDADEALRSICFDAISKMEGFIREKTGVEFSFSETWDKVSKEMEANNATKEENNS